MRLLFSILFTIIIQISASAQVQLERIGQTPGGAAYHVNYDSLSQRMFVGAGTSLWVYDMSDPEAPVILGKRSLLGLITETILYNNDVLFVASTFDGVYAIDLSSRDLQIIDHKYIDGLAKRAAYDMVLLGDTLLIPTNGRVARLKFSKADGFTFLSDVGPNIFQGLAFCIAERGQYVAVGAQGLFNGKIMIYNKENLNNPVTFWQDSTIAAVSKIRFSDLNDSIIYVCGGTSNAGFTSYFHALGFDGSNLAKLDSYDVAGIPYIAAANIQNIDSRNDTLFIATGCAVDPSMGLPLSYIPVFDASGLPSEPMEMIDYINGGLWHFDISLLDGTPYMATASEWLGIVVNNVTSGNPLDTLMVMPTGGWTHKSEVKGNNLWVAHEGWGLAAYNIDSLMFSNEHMTESMLLHFYEQDGPDHYFIGDFEFLNDTLILLGNGTVYNLKPWIDGGQPDSLYTTKIGGYLSSAHTNAGQRIISGTQSFVLPDLGDSQKMSIYDPFDPGGNVMNTIDVLNDVKSITVQGDTVFYGYRTDAVSKTKYLAASKIVDDQLIMIDSIATDDLNHINSISIDNNIVAVGKGNLIMWYSWDGSNFSYISSYFDFQMVEVDIVLKGDYIYVADRTRGLIVIDITDADNPVAASFDGRGTWKNLFGSQSLILDDHGKIFLSDFNAGVIIIEAFSNTSSLPDEQLVPAKADDKLIIYPNPSSSHIRIEIKNPHNDTHVLRIYNSRGQELKLINNISGTGINLEVGEFKNGVYFLELSDRNGNLASKKFIVR